MKINKSIFYCLGMIFTWACQPKPDGVEIGIGRFEQLYAQGHIKGLAYTKNDWVLIDLQEEFLQQNRIQAEFRSAGKTDRTAQRFIAKMISMEYLNELITAVKKDYPQAKQVPIRKIE